MSPRQQRLNALWAFYTTTHYDVCKYDWQGRENVGVLDREVIASAPNIPPGFVDVSGSTLPLKFRRPSAPYALIKVIVDRFTGLLFSSKKHPQVAAKGDDDTHDYVQSLIADSSLWANMIEVRKFGGAQGDFVVGFMFLNGKPIIEVHDPRWCKPKWKDQSVLKLESIEIRFKEVKEEEERGTGIWKEVEYWNRRVITETTDTRWKPQPVEDGDEPIWSDPNTIENEVVHGFGFCPVVWGQNFPVGDSIDGEPDCCSLVYDMSQAIDQLLSQSHYATLANLDPTLFISTDAELAEIRKGSDNAIKAPTGGSAHYLEIQGSGIKIAMDLAMQIRTLALEVAQCVLDHPDTASRTATEIERVYSSMLAKADILREQYGSKCVKPLVEMMVEAARKISVPTPDEEGKLIQPTIELSPKIVMEGEKETEKPVKLGSGGRIEVTWGAYFEPMLTDTKTATDAAASAKQAGIIDTETASRYVAPYFRVENVQAMIDRSKKESEEEEAKLEAEFKERMIGKPE